MEQFKARKVFKKKKKNCFAFFGCKILRNCYLLFFCNSSVGLLLNKKAKIDFAELGQVGFVLASLF